MFLFPLAMKLGAPITVGAFLTANLIPATLGNLMGGGLFVATAYGLAFGNLEQAVVGAMEGAWAAARGGGCCGRGRAGGSTGSLAGAADAAAVGGGMFAGQVAVRASGVGGGVGAAHPISV